MLLILWDFVDLSYFLHKAFQAPIPSKVDANSNLSVILLVMPAFFVQTIRFR